MGEAKGRNIAETVGNIILLTATALFMLVSASMLGSLLVDCSKNYLYERIYISIIAFFLGLFSYESSPIARGRLFRKIFESTDRKFSAEEFIEFQKYSGFWGTFNRMGLVGIPAAVAILTMVLFSLVLLANKLGYASASRGFMELSKLSLGAFIGTLSRQFSKSNNLSSIQ